MQNVTYINRGHPLLDALNQIIPQMQRQNQEATTAAQASQDADAARKQRLNELYLHSILSEADPARRAAAYASAAPDVQAMMPDPSKLPTPPPTLEDNNQQRAQEMSAAAMEKADPAAVAGQSMTAPAGSMMRDAAPLPVSGESTSGYQGEGDSMPPVAAPSVSDKYNGWFAAYVQQNKRAPTDGERTTKLTELTAGDQGLAEQAGIETKRNLSAKETQVDLPKVGPEIAEKRASAFEKTTAGQKNLVEIPKLSAETQKLKQEGADKSLVAQSLARDVVANPRSYFSLPTEDKKLVITALKGRVPANLNQNELKALDASDNGIQNLDNIKAIEDKWKARGVKITGPIIGRYNEAEQKWGDSILPSTMPATEQSELLGDVAKLREWLTIGPMQEAAALIGSRPAYQIIQKLEKANPELYQSTPIFEGSLAGMQQRLQQRKESIEKKSWGPLGPPQGFGSAPTDLGGGQAGVVPPSDAAMKYLKSIGH